MSNPDYVGIEGETFTEDELEDNFQDYLDAEMPEFEVGNLSYGAGRVLRKIDYTAFREAFNDWLDSEDHIDEWREDHPWLDEDDDDDGPVCEDCGEPMDSAEVALALADHGRLFCVSCEEDHACGKQGKARNGVTVLCSMFGEHTTHIAQAYDNLGGVYEITGVIWN